MAESKLVPHCYDLPRLEDILSGRKQIVCVFQQVKSVHLAGNGSLRSGTLDKLRELKNRMPTSTAGRVEYIPAVRYAGIEKIEPANYAAVADALIGVNEVITTKRFTFPQLMALSKDNRVTMLELFKVFQRRVKAKYPNAKVGVVLKPAQAQVFVTGCENQKPEFLIIESGVKSAVGMASVDQAIDFAGANSIETFCINAHIFIGTQEYAARFHAKPIAGFSINHGQPPIGVKPTYFNPDVTISTDSRYWTESKMVRQYGASYRLSSGCPCEECMSFDVNSWFARGHAEIINSNIRHKTLFVDNRQSYWIALTANINKIVQLIAKVPVPKEAVDAHSSEAEAKGTSAKQLSEKGLLSVISKTKIKAPELKQILKKEGYFFSTELLAEMVQRLLFGGRMQYAVEAGEFCLTC